MEFITHDLDGKAREARAFIIGGVCVVIGKMKVRLDVGCGWVRRRSMSSWSRFKVGVKTLCRSEKITAMEVVTGNVNLGSLPTIVWGRCRGAWLRSTICQRVLIVVRSMLW